MSLAWATITLCVMCPLMSSPRMSWARARASSGLSASLTPPALPRPPTFTCALTTTVVAISRAIASASSGVSATPPGSTGTPCDANRSRAWYSKRSTIRHRSPREIRPLHRQGSDAGHSTGDRLLLVRNDGRPGALRRWAASHAARSPTTRSSPVRRAATVLVASLLTAGGTAALAPPAAAADIVPRDLTITVTHVGPEDLTCQLDADLY